MCRKMKERKGVLRLIVRAEFAPFTLKQRFLFFFFACARALVQPFFLILCK